MNSKINASKRSLVIAVDGPAASGKGTLAKRIAQHYRLPHLDTGLLYRAVGFKLVMARKHAARDSDQSIAIHAAQNLSVTDLANNDLGSEEIGQAASIVSAFPEVRDALLDYQYSFAAQEGGAVLDGRDIGTVICPDADVKLYVTASDEVRAQRRFLQQQKLDANASYDAILAAIRTRDTRDSTRDTAPLAIAEDAVVLDTSTLTIEEVFATALKIIDR